MTDPVFVAEEIVLAIHEEQLAEHGGLVGIRDHGLLSSALSRPLMKAQFGEVDLAVLAAAYAYGIARNHPFLDGNKRTALAVSETFLELNGVALTASDQEAVITFLALAAGEFTEEALADWFRTHQRALP
jgi:death-on-curing protein